MRGRKEKGKTMVPGTDRVQEDGVFFYLFFFKYVHSFSFVIASAGTKGLDDRGS